MKEQNKTEQSKTEQNKRQTNILCIGYEKVKLKVKLKVKPEAKQNKTEQSILKQR